MLRNIEAERVRNGFTKEELARKLKVSSKTYYNWVYEETEIPSSALIKMSYLFKTSIDYLLEGSINTYLPTKSKDKQEVSWGGIECH